MRAAVVEEPGGAVSVVDDVEIDEPRHGEVLVRIAYCGVCHSDLSAQHSPFLPHPAVLGHEASGQVEAIGAGVDSCAPGDTVIVCVSAPCGHCYFCVRSQPAICVSGSVVFTGVLGDGGSRLFRNGSVLYRGMGMGGFAEYVVVPAAAVVPVGVDVPLDVACLLGCGVGTGLGAVLNTAAVPAGSTVLVYGLGGVGMAVVQAARAVGASEIIVVDPVQERREMASGFGATEALDPLSDDVAGRVRRITEVGADYAFDTAGRSEVFSSALAALRPGGVLTCVGTGSEAAYKIDMPPLFVTSEKVIRGCSFGSSHAQRDIPRYLALWRNGSIDLESMVTKRRPLDEVSQAFDDLHAGRGLRTVLTVDRRK
jgi:Zn-dependent alcohol dehydrogenase